MSIGNIFSSYLSNLEKSFFKWA